MSGRVRTEKGRNRELRKPGIAWQGRRVIAQLVIVWLLQHNASCFNCRFMAL